MKEYWTIVPPSGLGEYWVVTLTIAVPLVDRRGLALRGCCDCFIFCLLFVTFPVEG